MIFLSFFSANAQQHNDSMYKIQIQGFVFDELCNPIEGALVMLYQGGIIKAGVQTDKHGYYKMSYPDPGKFDMIMARTANYKCVGKKVGYIGPGSLSTIELDMAYGHDCFPRGGHKVPLIDRFKPEK